MKPPAPVRWTAPTSVRGALAAAAAHGLDRLDAQLLLSHLLHQPRAWLVAHDDAPLEAVVAAGYEALVNRRLAGEPLAYLVGEREFHGLVLQVSPAVLVPRPDTETLVDWALELLAARPPGPPPAEVLDLGTGSGAIALAVQHRCPGCRVSATDRSEPALDQARRNAQRLRLPVEFLAGDWWAALPAGRRFDLVLSNPPYIAGDDPHLAALTHEPLQALTPGGDGLDAIRCIVAGAASHLQPGGGLLFEHGWDQAAAVRALLRQAGFQQVQSRQDLEGRDRCTGGFLP